MKILIESGVVIPRKQGKWTYYSINEKGCAEAVEILKKLTEVNIDKDNTDNDRCCD
jgi:ArsR family transcriptional regulator